MGLPVAEISPAVASSVFLSIMKEAKILGEVMPFVVGAGVFVVSKVDTGEVASIPEANVNRVEYDVIKGSGDHHDRDLRPLPLQNERIYRASYYYVVTAGVGEAGRFHKTRCYKNGRGRIY